MALIVVRPHSSTNPAFDLAVYLVSLIKLRWLARNVGLVSAHLQTNPALRLALCALFLDDNFIKDLAILRISQYDICV